MKKVSFDNLEYAFSALYESFYEDINSEEEEKAAAEKFDAIWSTYLLVAGWTYQEWQDASDAVNDEDHVCEHCKDHEESASSSSAKKSNNTN